jgi:hypothetical protein
MTDEPLKLEDSNDPPADTTDVTTTVPDGENSEAPSETSEAAPTVAPSNSGLITENTKTVYDVPDDLENLGYLGEPKDVEIGYTFESHLDPRRQVDGTGVYLDDIQRRDAELIRARAEGREPDLDNPPAVASTPLVPSVVAQANAGPGVVTPVDSVEVVNVGVPADATEYNSAAAEAHARANDNQDEQE